MLMKTKVTDEPLLAAAVYKKMNRQKVKRPEYTEVEMIPVKPLDPLIKLALFALIVGVGVSGFIGLGKLVLHLSSDPVGDLN